MTEPVTVTISPQGLVTDVEGKNLTINCTDGMSSGSTMRLQENGVQLTNSNALPDNLVVDQLRTFALPLNRSKNGNIYKCISVTTGNMSSGAINLNVACKWKGSVVVRY